MIRFLILFLASVPLWATTVNCTGSDATAIQSALNSGGTVTLVGTNCNIGGTTLNMSVAGTTLQGSGSQAQIRPSGCLSNYPCAVYGPNTPTVLTYTGGGYAITSAVDNGTITGLTINGGGIQNTKNYTAWGNGTCISNWVITNNTFQNITNGTNGIDFFTMCGMTVQNDYFYNVWQGGYPYAPCGSQCTAGGGIHVYGGEDHTLVDNNHFFGVASDNINIDWGVMSGSGVYYHLTTGNVVSNNDCQQSSRYCIEQQSSPDGNCPGGCKYYASDGMIWKGNFYHNFANAQSNIFCITIPTDMTNTQLLNNDCSQDNSNTGYRYGDAYELDMDQLIQGNVMSNIAAVGPSGSNAHWASGYPTYPHGHSYTINNNLQCGISTNPVDYSWYPAPNNTYAQIGNYFATTCPGDPNISVSSISPSFTTADNQAFPSGGTGTWKVGVISRLAVKNVSFYLDGSFTPIVYQETQNVSITFASDRTWLYQAVFSVNGLSTGTHSILAVATDVSNTSVATATQHFTFGSASGPVASISPSSLNFGNQQTFTTSAAQVITMTNTGTATMSISSIAVTGTNSADFSQTNTCGSTLAMSASCTVSVTFTPSATGGRSASVVFTDNATGSPQSVTLSGTGTVGAPPCAMNNLLQDCQMQTAAATSSGVANWTWTTPGTATVGQGSDGPGGVTDWIVTINSVSPGNNEFRQTGLALTSGQMYALSFSGNFSRSQVVNFYSTQQSSPYAGCSGTLSTFQPHVRGGSTWYTYYYVFVANGNCVPGSGIAGQVTFQFNSAQAGDVNKITAAILTPITSSPFTASSLVTGSVTHAGAKAVMSTASASSATLQWDYVSGSCGEYAYSDTDGVTQMVHSWFVGGANPNSILYWQWCVGTTGSGEQSFTTQPLPVPHPSLATLPQVSVPATYTAPTGTVRTLGVGGCTSLAACFAIASCGDSIQITAGTTWSDYTTNVGTGVSYLPAMQCGPANSKPPLYIQSSAASSLLPPPGVRLDPTAYASSTATLEMPLVNMGNLGTTRSNLNCFAGSYWWDYAANAAGWHMNYCAGNTPVALTSVTGSVSSGYFIGTYTTSGAHGFSVGDMGYASGISGTNPSLASGSFTVLAVPSSTTFTAQTQNTYCIGSYPTCASTASGTGGQVNNNSWQSVPFTAVTLASLPGTCTTGQWGYQASGATQNYDSGQGPIAGTSTGQVVRCTATNVWSPWKIVLQDPFTPNFFTYALDLSGQQGIWIGPGIRFSRVRPTPDANWLQTGNVTTCTFTSCPDGQPGKVGNAYIQTSLTSSNIVLDRDFLDGLDYPYGMVVNEAVLNGNNIAVVNSTISGGGTWWGAVDRGSFYDDQASAALLRSGGNGFLFQNNFIQCNGICLHNDDSATGFYANANGSVIGNTFFRNLSQLYGSSQNAATYPNTYWPERQLLEFKSGQQWLVNGNTFTNNWRNVSAGAAIELTPRMDSGVASGTVSSGTLTFTALNSVTNGQVNTSAFSTTSWLDLFPAFGSEANGTLYAVTSIPNSTSVVLSPAPPNGSYWIKNATWASGVLDMTIQNNTISGVPNAINGFASLSLDNTGRLAIQGLSLQRLTMQNNLYNSVLDDGTRQDPDLWQTSGGGTVLETAAHGALDWISQHETQYGIGGLATSIWYSYQGEGLSQVSEGALVQNNLGTMITSTSNSPLNGNGVVGSAMFSTYFSQYLIGPNAYYCCGGMNPGGYPSAVKWASSLSSIGWYNAGSSTFGSNFHLKSSSPYISGAPAATSDGLDFGANIDTLLQAQNVVQNAHVYGITAGGTSATVSFIAPDSNACSVDWTSNGFSSFTRVAGTATQVQNISLTGLPNNTALQSRINCYSPKVVNFQTQ